MFSTMGKNCNKLSNGIQWIRFAIFNVGIAINATGGDAGFISPLYEIQKSIAVSSIKIDLPKPRPAQITRTWESSLKTRIWFLCNDKDRAAAFDIYF